MVEVRRMGCDTVNPKPKNLKAENPNPLKSFRRFWVSAKGFGLLGLICCLCLWVADLGGFGGVDALASFALISV